MAQPPSDGVPGSDKFQSHDEIMLGVLTAIDRDSHTSQRSISRELGVALGLANAYLKRCVNKGLIKIQQVPHRRYAYYLTPSGFSEKARLTGQYLSASFTFFRRAREQMNDLIAHCAAHGNRRIVLSGISELADVGILCAADHDVRIVAVCDERTAGSRYRGVSVAGASNLPPFDAIIVTDLAQPEFVYRAHVDRFGRDKVLAPRILGISVPHAEAAAEPAEQRAVR